MKYYSGFANPRVESSRWWMYESFPNHPKIIVYFLLLILLFNCCAHLLSAILLIFALCSSTIRLNNPTRRLGDPTGLNIFIVMIYIMCVKFYYL